VAGIQYDCAVLRVGSMLFKAAVHATVVAVVMKQCRLAEKHHELSGIGGRLICEGC